MHGNLIEKKINDQDKNKNLTRESKNLVLNKKQSLYNDKFYEWY